MQSDEIRAAIMVAVDAHPIDWQRGEFLGYSSRGRPRGLPGDLFLESLHVAG